MPRRVWMGPPGIDHLITCNLTKPETTLDQIRKACPELKPTDAALISTALIEAGRFAAAVYDGKDYEWMPENHEPLTKAILAEVQQVQTVIDPEKPKKTTKAAKEVVDEPVTLTIPLRASQKAGEFILGSRDDLKTKLSDLLTEGVEYLFSPTDIGWQWSLERVNWATVTGGELSRRIRFGVDFVDGSIAVELGPGGKKKVAKKKA